MSDDESVSGSSATGDDISTTGLIATRAKRQGAGNLYYSDFRDLLEDEEIRKELLADDEDDEGEYEDEGGEDEVLESSSDEEDAGPPAEGALEDLTGERELQKAERSEQRKKRKMVDAKMKLPAFAKKKKVQLANNVKMEGGTEAPKPKKKSERSNWLPTAADAPMRQSNRRLAVQNRETVHDNLKQSYERSEKQRRVMKKAAEREKSKARQALTQEERMKMCEKIAKQTDKEFGRWEREEAERQKARDEQMAAKRRRGIDGPMYKQWSGSAIWRGTRMELGRVEHGSKTKEELLSMGASTSASGTSTQASAAPAASANPGPSSASDPTQAPNADDSAPPPAIPPTEANASTTTPTPSVTGVQSTSGTLTSTSVQSVATDTSSTIMHSSATLQPAIAPATATVPAQASTSAPPTWLSGIHDYAYPQAAPPPQPAAPSGPVAAQSNEPAAPAQPPSFPAPAHAHPPPQAQAQASGPSLTPFMPVHQYQHNYTGWPPVPQTQQAPTITQPPAPVPPPPTLREQAMRTLVILDQFPDLDPTPSTSSNRTRPAKSAAPALPINDLAPHVLPPTEPLTADQLRYLLARHRVPRRNATTTAGDSLMPPAPEKTKCAIIPTQDAKFRDPKTGLGYLDQQCYKILQRAASGGCVWSAGLGCWVGNTVGETGGGRAARGVPEGFC